MNNNVLPPGMTALTFLATMNKDAKIVTEMFEMGAPTMLGGALAALSRGTSVDDLGGMAVRMAANQPGDFDFCPLHRAEAQEYEGLITTDTETYVRSRCKSEGHVYFPPAT